MPPPFEEGGALSVTPVRFLTELWAFFQVIAHLAGASVSYGHISSLIISVCDAYQTQTAQLRCISASAKPSSVHTGVRGGHGVWLLPEQF